MRTIIIASAVLACAQLAACSSPIVADDDLGYMSRTEVSAAITECEDAGQRALTTYAKADWKGKKVPVPVAVTCAPRGHGNLRIGMTRDD